MRNSSSKIFKALIILLILVVSIASLTSCNKEETGQFYVYGTFLEVTSNKGSSNNAVYDYIASLEAILSPTVEGSDLYKINYAAKDEVVTCNSVTMEIMKKAEIVYTSSNGAYDPSVYPLVRLWNFSSDKFGFDQTIPTQEQITTTKALCGLSSAFRIDYENSTITKLIEGAMLDFGGVAKGYVAQMSRDKMSGEGLINLGGNITVKDKTCMVGIGNPSREDRKNFTTSCFAKLTLEKNMCIATSGDYERYYKVDNTIYCHIINPTTGAPQDTSSSIISCSIISEDGAIGDAVATAVIIIGKDAGIKLINDLNLQAVIIDCNYEMTLVNIEATKC